MILETKNFQLFNSLKLGLYSMMLVIIPVLVIKPRFLKAQVIKYAFFMYYFVVYSVFEILIYSLIDMTYNTATIIDMLFVLLAPIFVNKRYFLIVSSALTTKMVLIFLFTLNTSVVLGLIIMLALDMVALIILMMFLNYLKHTHQLFEVKSEIEVYKTISYKDELTGVYNKRYMNLAFQVIEDNEEKQYAIIMFDMDNFKTINDSYNHLIGDQVLKCIVEHVKEQLEYEDLMVRYGGDEFVLILKGRSLEDSIHKLEEIKTSLETTPIQIDYREARHMLHVSQCFGLYYVCQNDDIKPFEALKEADNLLVSAKQVENVNN